MTITEARRYDEVGAELSAPTRVRRRVPEHRVAEAGRRKVHARRRRARRVHEKRVTARRGGSR